MARFAWRVVSVMSRRPVRRIAPMVRLRRAGHTSSVTDITIGRHQAKRAVETSGPGYCSVYFAICDTANVSVTALYLNDTPRACSVADRAAALIEPKLPQTGRK